MNYLQQYPFDVIKIDQRFTRGIGTSQEVVRMVRALAEALNARVIAEGVETPEQRDLLIELGCVFGQGYYYSKPMPTEAFHRLLVGGGHLPVAPELEDEAANRGRDALA